MAEKKMDIQREEGMKSYFMVPKLLLISESIARYFFFSDISCDHWAAPLFSSLPLNIAEHLSFNVSIGRGETEEK